jgi:hypothetical protein
VQVAVINSSSLKTADAAFLVQACAEQALEFATAWGIDPISVALYESTVGLPADDVWVCEYVDKLDVDGAEAYHSVDDAGRPYLRCLPPSSPLDATDLSHEILETMGDPTADRWVKMPDGSEIAVEVCDPVQAESYIRDTTVLGETRSVKVSSFVLPGFFDASSPGPYDRLGSVKAPFGMSSGGYEAVLDATGNETNVFARIRYSPGKYTNSESRWAAGRKLADPSSRLLRRLRGKK